MARPKTDPRPVPNVGSTWSARVLLADDILFASQSDSGLTILQPVDLRTDRQNQFLLLVKPESLWRPRPSQSERILNLIFEALKLFYVDTLGAIVVSGMLLSKTGITDRHYGYINHMSRHASTALVGHSASTVRELVHAPKATRILGGHELLAMDSALDANLLNDLWALKPARRLRSGLYVQLHEFDGEPFVVINGFHPKQLANFSSPDAHTVALIATCDLPWAILRRHMIGDTFPAEALRGSIRRTIWEQRFELGFQQVDESNNCVHMSSGPIEALSEILNFSSVSEAVSVDAEACQQVRHLRRVGWAGSVEYLLSNPPVRIGTEPAISLFELTEGLDGYSSAELFARLPACLES